MLYKLRLWNGDTTTLLAHLGDNSPGCHGMFSVFAQIPSIHATARKNSSTLKEITLALTLKGLLIAKYVCTVVLSPPAYWEGLKTKKVKLNLKLDFLHSHHILTLTYQTNINLDKDTDTSNIINLLKLHSNMESLKDILLVFFFF